MSTDKDIITNLTDSIEDYIEDDIDKFIITDKEYINVYSIVNMLKDYDIYDLSRIISYLTNIITRYDNTEYLSVKRHYEINLIKVKTIEYLNNCQYTKRYIPTEFSDYLNFDNVLNDYINFLYDYYYDKESVDKYYEKIDTYFNSLFSILELKIDLLNHNDIKSKIKIEYDLLTDKILNLLTNINIIVNNKF